MTPESSHGVLAMVLERFADLLMGDAEMVRLAVRGMLGLVLILGLVLLFRWTVILFGEFDDGSLAILVVLANLWISQCLA